MSVFRFKLALVATLLLLALQAVPALAREMSKAGDIFQTAKNGVVTIITAGHGSGFLMDKTENYGLIVTNNHVVNEAGATVRVRFGAGSVVEGRVLNRDRLNDIAIVWVNLEKVPDTIALEAFQPPPFEDVVLIGEKVMAIGSPVNWETLEKTLTDGIVSKYDNKRINHDANINPGNSGGPLLNFDGQVVGMNTFSMSGDHGPGIYGAVSIEHILPELKKAKDTLAKDFLAPTLVKPKAALLNDIPNIGYPIEILKKLGKGSDEPYELDTRYYHIELKTPAITYRALQADDKAVLAKRKARAKKYGYHVSEDELITGEVDNNSFLKPVIQVEVHPKIKQTNSSIFKDVLKIAAGGIYAIPSAIRNGTYEFKRDFESLKLVDSSLQRNICDPLVDGKSSVRANYKDRSFLWDKNIKVVDKSYTGHYEYDSKCFETPGTLSFVIESEGTAEAVSVSVPEKIKSSIRNDFKPYWDYVKTTAAANP